MFNASQMFLLYGACFSEIQTVYAADKESPLPFSEVVKTQTQWDLYRDVADELSNMWLLWFLWFLTADCKQAVDATVHSYSNTALISPHISVYSLKRGPTVTMQTTG
jgi:hypothetical protein